MRKSFIMPFMKIFYKRRTIKAIFKYSSKIWNQNVFWITVISIFITLYWACEDETIEKKETTLKIHRLIVANLFWMNYIHFLKQLFGSRLLNLLFQMYSELNVRKRINWEWHFMAGININALDWPRDTVDFRT